MVGNEIRIKVPSVWKAAVALRKNGWKPEDKPRGAMFRWMKRKGDILATGINRTTVLFELDYTDINSPEQEQIATVVMLNEISKLKENFK